MYFTVFSNKDDENDDDETLFAIDPGEILSWGNTNKSDRYV